MLQQPVVGFKYASDMKTYVFKVDVEQENGRWVAEVPSLPGCVTEGDSREEALEALTESTQAYVEVTFEHGDPLPAVG